MFNLLKDFKIAQKILVMNSIIVLAIIISLTYLWLMLSKIEHASDMALVKQKQKIVQTGNLDALIASFKNTVLLEITMLATGSTDIEAQVNASKLSLNKMIKQSGLSTKQQTTLQQQLKAIFSQHTKALDSITVGDVDLAVTQMAKASSTANKIESQLALNKQTLTKEMLALSSSTIRGPIQWLHVVIIIVGIILSLAAIFVAFLIGRLVAPSIKRAIEQASTISKGDLTRPITINSKDEIGLLLQSLSDMQDVMRDVIIGITSASTDINHRVTEVRAGNIELSQRTEQQAGALGAVSLKIEELASGVANTASQANKVQQLSSAAYTKADKGSEVVKQVALSIEDINKGSDKMAAIVSAIDEIAFQTNLLALNAAVEAARAGDQGRGFAVVANEVRELAQRSALSAKEIGELIQSSISKYQDCAELANQSDEALHSIQESIDHVKNEINSINQATAEQSNSLNSLQATIKDVDNLTQENAAMVEELASSALKVEDNANTMSEKMQYFTLKSHSTEVD